MPGVHDRPGGCGALRGPVSRREVHPIPKLGLPPKKPRKGMKRSRIRQKPVEFDPERDALRRRVITRDRECVLLALDPNHRSRCTGGSDVHELRKRSAGGSIYDDRNCVFVCNAGNTVDIEGYPDWAHALGLVCRRGETLEDCWLRMAAARRGEVDLSGIRRPS